MNHQRITKDHDNAEFALGWCSMRCKAKTQLLDSGTINRSLVVR